MLVSGYSRQYREPEIWSIRFEEDGTKDVANLVSRGRHTVIFGGQRDVISRVVNGFDGPTMYNYFAEVNRIANEYKDHIQDHLADKGITIDLPSWQDCKISVSDDWANGITADLSQFTEQSAIDLVDFLVTLMVKAQAFSNRLPTVGGEVHVAMITKQDGFRWISEEKFTYRGRDIPRYPQ